MSRYENYAIKNNVFGTLSTPISSLATTIQLGDGQGARFSVNQLATLENVEDGKVKKREIVKITAITGDVLTVIRKYAPCPSSDDANTQGQVSYAFSSDDTISAYITKEHFDVIDNSINDIYENGLDKLRTDVISGLQVKISGGPILIGSSYYDFAGGTLTLTNNATNYIEIDEDGNLVVNTTDWTLENAKISKVITSGGEITSIEDWRLGTVGGKIGGTDIHELTEKPYINKDDEFLITDSENIYQNKKIKAENILLNLGDGSDGNCVVSSDTIMEAKKYNFENFTVCSGVKLCFCGDAIPVIKVRGLFDNQGEIYLQNIHLTKKIANIVSPIGIVKTVANIEGLSEIVEEIGGAGGDRAWRRCAGTLDCVVGYCGANGGDGGGIGESGCNGCDDGTRTGGTGGTGTEFAGGGGGGGGGGCGTCAGCPGGNASGCTGGNGGVGGVCGGGGGGGGFGLCKGGDGGNGGAGNYAGSGGNGGNSCCLGGNGGNGGGGSSSYYGKSDGGRGGDGYCCGGNGGVGCVNGNGGDGGNGIMVKGGNGGCANSSGGGKGGNGGYSVYGCGGAGGAGGGGWTYQRGDGGNGGYGYIRGGNGGKGGDCSGNYPGGDGGRGGDSYLKGGTGGEGGRGLSAARHNGGDGGDSRMGMYTLVVFGDCICAGIICGPGGDGGNGGKGGCGGRGGDMQLIASSSVLCALSCRGRDGKDGTDGKDGEVILVNCFII